MTVCSDGYSRGYSHGLTHDEAKAVQADQAHRVGTLFRALDLDGDGIISADEIDRATESLLALDLDGDGQLSEDECGGPFRYPGGGRTSAIYRILDLDGDGVITAADIADAPARLRRLDRLGKGHLTPADNGMGGNAVRQNWFDGPAHFLQNQDTLRSYVLEDTGEVLPGTDPRQDPSFHLVQEHANAMDVWVARDLYLLDSQGERVHRWPARNHASETVSARLRDDGLLIRTSCPGIWLDTLAFPVGAHGIVSIEEPDGTVVWQWELFEPGRRVLHHSFDPMPNGNILVTMYDGRTFDEAVDLGWIEQDREVLLRPPDLTRWWTESILELEPNLETGETRVVWEWHSIDHLVQDADADKPFYGEIGPGCRKIDLNYTRYENYRFNMGQVMHVNSVSYDPARDQILLSSAMHGELWIIDHATTTEEAAGPAGDLLYRCGNQQAHKGGPVKTFDWQHDIGWIPPGRPGAGNVLVFNNGARSAGDLPAPHPKRLQFGDGHSEILELSMPVDDEGAWTWDLDDPLNAAEIVWSYNADGSNGWFSPFMSGAARLPNGNTVTALGFNKQLREVTPEGETVMDLRPGGAGRVFRAVPIDADHPGLACLGISGR